MAGILGGSRVFKKKNNLMKIMGVLYTLFLTFSMSGQGQAARMYWRGCRLRGVIIKFISIH